jgi:hypothetical protein
MKIPSFAAAIVILSAASAFALSDADITPPALVGRTLEFEIENGGSPFATNGSWSGTFAGTKNGFSVGNIEGDTVPISTTYSVTIDGAFTVVTLAKFVEGQSSATLTLYTFEGVGRYEVSIQGVSGVSLNGTFTLRGSSVIAPEIDVRQSNGTKLKDGVGKKSLGAVPVDETGAAKKFIIKNIGKIPLKNLDISIDGKNKSDFIVSKLKKDKLDAGDRLEFTVKFRPSDPGTREAEIHIKSNDKNENPFDIKLTGEGTK